MDSRFRGNDGREAFKTHVPESMRGCIDVREKLPRYREAGIDEIWFIDRFQRCVLAERKKSAGYATQTLDSGRLGSVVVPGFWIEVAWLWQDELPATLHCLRQILGAV